VRVVCLRAALQSSCLLARAVGGGGLWIIARSEVVKRIKPRTHCGCMPVMALEVHLGSMRCINLRFSCFLVTNLTRVNNALASTFKPFVLV